TKYIDTATATLPLPPEDRVLFIRFYKCVLVGVYLDWLDNGMNYNLEKSCIRITELHHGSGKQAILKSAETINPKY
ncbi:MAG: TetR-like C-terminal domain-containing protein, partial [Lachnospiraceae bacterium]